ncbi:hypothetical protein C8R45DRAFT_923054 [Mycena sanguinolenta]|nr:hypothetical protein C8R45DRAFT_923054 [Mycena sanguinolenta]
MSPPVFVTLSVFLLETSFFQSTVIFHLKQQAVLKKDQEFLLISRPCLDVPSRVPRFFRHLKPQAVLNKDQEYSASSSSPQAVFLGSSSSNSDPPQMAKMTLPRSFNSPPPSRAWANLHSTRTRSSLSRWRANGCTAERAVELGTPTGVRPTLSKYSFERLASSSSARWRGICSSSHILPHSTSTCKRVSSRVTAASVAILRAVGGAPETDLRGP